MSKLPRRRFIVVLVLAVILLLAFLWAPLMERGQGADVRKAYQEESSALDDAISSLGVVGTPSPVFQCATTLTTHFQTQKSCQNFSNYEYSFSPISDQTKQDYASNAARFDKLLKDRGWVNDRPQDKVTSLVDSNPYLERNGGEGGSVPFHKNIGAVNCNLKIDFSGFKDTASPGAINVIEFSCQRDISYFALHLRTRGSTGP